MDEWGNHGDLQGVVGLRPRDELDDSLGPLELL